MQSGLNSFPVLVTDISGAKITGLTQGDFIVSGYVSETVIDAGTITEAPSSAGYYNVLINIPVGQGFVSVSTSASNFSITPTFYNVDATIYDTDDIYATVARQTLDVSQVSLTNYETQDIGPFKEGDDVVIDYVIPDAITTSISGYTDWKASLYDSEILTSISGAGYIKDFVLTVNTTTKSIKMVLPAITGGMVAEGLTEEYFYSDLQATTNEGYRKTLAEFNLKFRRNFTRP